MKLIWIILSLAVMPIFGDPDVRIEFVTSTANETHTDYYDGEDVTIRCTATGFTNIGELTLYKVEEASSNPTLVSCSLRSNAWVATTSNVATSLGLSSIAPSDCEPTAATGTSVIATSGPINSLKDIKFNCYGTELDRSIEKTTPTIAISGSEIKDAPENLTMNIPTIIEDEEFTFNCSSTGAAPVSAYEYSITSVDGVSLATSNTYTPVKADRGGIILKCRDIEHALWTNQSVLYKENATKPRYIEGEGGIKPGVELNPAVENTRKCTVTGYPIEYEWTCDNCPENTANGNILTLGAGATVGSKSNITCTATVQGVGNRTQVWEVIWTPDATTPSTTTTATPDDDDPNLGPGPWPWWIIIIVIVVIIIIGLFVYFCYYKKKDVNSTTNKEKDKNGTDPESVRMTERGDKPDSNMPGKQKHQNSSKRPKTKPKQPETPKPQPTQYPNDPIIYAELDHSQQPKGQVKPVQATTPVVPSDGVLYSSIDIVKTDRAKQKPNGNPDNGQAYENLGNQGKGSKAGKPPAPPAEQPVYAEVDKKKSKSNGNGNPDTGEAYENLGRPGKAAGSSMPRNNAPAPPTSSPGAGRYGNV